MRLSVVIPCFNEEKNIGGLVEALKAQDFPRDDFEIIAVDNASADNTSEEARKAGADKVLLEKNKGTNFARQAGFAASGGIIVAFIDADCLPPKDWLKKIYAVFEHDKNGEIGILSGPYRYDDLGFLMRLFSDLWQRVMIVLIIIGDFFFRKKWAAALGGNMAVRRTALEAVGGMDTKFTFFGDDSDTALRIRRAGYKAKFDRSIIVTSSARRLEKKGFVRTAGLYTAAYVKLYFGKNKPLGVDENHKIEKIEQLKKVPREKIERLKKMALKGYN